MGNFKTFAEYLEERDAERRATDATQPVLFVVMIVQITGSDRDEPGIPGGRDQVAERSIFRVIFMAVNPARPVNPINSRLLTAPIRKRLKSQVMGK